MNLHKKVFGIIVSGLLALTNITSFAQAEQKPQTGFSVEAKRTEIGICYDIYIENPSFLSTLFFEMNFDGEINSDGDKKCEATLEKNDCFDILYTEWNSGNKVSVKGYLGRSGNEAGFSSDEKIKVAKITIPLAASQTGEFNANVLNAICAGITETDGTALKGNVKVSETSIKYSAKTCSVLAFSRNSVDIFSAENRNVDVIIAAYNQSGGMINAYKENIALLQGKNTLDISGVDFSDSDSISVMIWDGIASMCPLADKTTINK